MQQSASLGRKIWRKIQTSWSLDLRSLSLFRVALWLMIIADLCLRSRYLLEHYTDLGIFPRIAMQSFSESATTFSLHAASGQFWYEAILFLIHGIIAFLFLAGYRTKLMNILLIILTISLHNRTMIINSAADDLLRMTIFWSIFLPLDRYWSWDQKKYTTEEKPNKSLIRIISIGTVAYILQQFCLYWVTAYLKLWPEWYVNHIAVYDILSLETFHLPLSDIVFHFPHLMQIITAGSMVVEFFGPLLLVMPFMNTWTRYLGIAMIFALHTGIVTHISVGIFPWISMISILALIPSHFWEKVIPRFAPRGSLTVHYDDHCGLCGRWIVALQNYGTLFGVKYQGLSASTSAIQKLSEENDMWVISRERKYFLGYAGFVECMKQSWLFRCIGLIGNWRLFKALGNKLYDMISAKRKFCTLPMPVQPIREKRWIKALGVVICFVSLYCSIAVNVSVMLCGGSWQNFFRTWPLSFISVVEERGTQLFENGDGKPGWFGPHFLAPIIPAACTQAQGVQFDLTKKYQWSRTLFSLYTKTLWWWTMVPRLDQYWWMFAPHPILLDHWFVIDATLIPKNHTPPVERDLWRDYVFWDNSDGAVSFQKYANPEVLTISDRWRKYTYNVIENKPTYLRYFAEYWCKKYNTSENPDTLDRFTIYDMSQGVLPNYIPWVLVKKSLWQHCCINDGCFQNKAKSASPTPQKQ